MRSRLWIPRAKARWMASENSGNCFCHSQNVSIEMPPNAAANLNGRPSATALQIFRTVAREYFVGRPLHLRFNVLLMTGQWSAPQKVSDLFSIAHTLPVSKGNSNRERDCLAVGQRLETTPLPDSKEWHASANVIARRSGIRLVSAYHFLALPLLASCGHPVNSTGKTLRAFAR